MPGKAATVFLKFHFAIDPAKFNLSRPIVEASVDSRCFAICRGTGGRCCRTNAAAAAIETQLDIKTADAVQIRGALMSDLLRSVLLKENQESVTRKTLDRIKEVRLFSGRFKQRKGSCRPNLVSSPVSFISLTPCLVVGTPESIQAW
jgi:hypothetical protein